MKEMIKKILTLVLFVLFAAGISAQTYEGKASYYGRGFHGRRAADGSVYNMHQMTCAHKTLPFGTRLRVTNKSNGKSVVVTVTDRGPYVRGRIVDLSLAAATEIGMISSGVATVTVEVLKSRKEKLLEATRVKPMEMKQTGKITSLPFKVS